MTSRSRAFISIVLLGLLSKVIGVHHAEPSQGSSKGALMRRDTSRSKVAKFNKNDEAPPLANQEAVVVTASGLLRDDGHDLPKSWCTWCEASPTPAPPPRPTPAPTPPPPVPVYCRGSGCVPAPEGVRLSGTASQKSTYSSSYSADKGNDGNGNTMAHTTGGHGETNPWWQVDLGSSCSISAILFQNRRGACASRLFFDYSCSGDTESGWWGWQKQRVDNGPIFGVSETPCQGEVCSGQECEQVHVPRRNGYAINCAGKRGRYVYVQLPGPRRMLNFMEMSVYGYGQTQLSSAAESGDYSPPAEKCLSGGLNEVLRSDCNDFFAMAKNVGDALKGQPTSSLRPAVTGKQILAELLAEGGDVWFKRPGEEAAVNALDLVERGHAVLVELNDKQKEWMKDNGLNKRSELKTASSALQKKAIRDGVLDMVGMVAGPLGVAFALAGAFYGFGEAQELPEVIEALGSEILKACHEMIASAILAERLQTAKDYVTVFNSEARYVMDGIRKIAANPGPDSGTMQFILLQSLETSIASSRYQWLPYLKRPDNCNRLKSCDDPCAKTNAAIAQTVPTLIALHISVLQQMARVVANHEGLVDTVRDKFRTVSCEYFHYARRFVAYKEHASNYPYSPIGTSNPIDVCVRGHWTKAKQLFDELRAFADSIYEVIPHITSNGVGGTFCDIIPKPYSLFQHNATSETRVQQPQQSASMARLPPLLGDLHQDFHRICGESLECFFRSETSEEDAAAYRALSRKLMSLLEKP